MKERRFNYEEIFVAVYGIYYVDDAFAAYGDCRTLKEKGDELHEKKKEQAVFSFSLTSACVFPRTFFVMTFPSLSYPAVYRPSQRPSFRLRMLPSPLARFLLM